MQALTWPVPIEETARNMAGLGATHHMRGELDTVRRGLFHHPQNESCIPTVNGSNPDSSRAFMEIYVSLCVCCANLSATSAQSITLYRTALELVPNSFSVMNNLGAVYQLQSKDHLALATLNAALAIDPDMTEARANAATVLHVSHVLLSHTGGWVLCLVAPH
jgi:tetratricopeptide (TPR) repeat protein